MEVKIGSRWYVCSPYIDWKHLLHAKYVDEEQGWDIDDMRENYLIKGTFEGFANDWTVEP